MINFFERIVVFITKHKFLFLGIVVVVFIIIFSIFNPYKDKFFPKCSFYMVTGYKCPGCGSQRAIFDILHLKISSAVKENLLLILLLPYLFFGIFFEELSKKSKIVGKIYNSLFSAVAGWIIFFTVILFWIGRNTHFYNSILNRF